MDPTRARPRSASVRDPSSSVGRPNIVGSGAGCCAQSAGNSPRWLTTAMKWAIPAPHPRCRYVSFDGTRGRQGRLSVGEELGERRLVGHQGPHVLGIAGDERQCVDRAAAAREQVDRPAFELLDDPMQVVGVLIGCRRVGRLVQLAALAATWVVGDHGAVGEMARKCGEAGGGHRRTDQEQGSGVRRAPRPNFVGQSRARHLQGCGGFVRSDVIVLPLSLRLPREWRRSGRRPGSCPPPGPWRGAVP